MSQSSWAWIFEPPTDTEQISLGLFAPEFFEFLAGLKLLLGRIETPFGPMHCATCALDKITGQEGEALVYLGFGQEEETLALAARLKKRWSFFDIEITDAAMLSSLNPEVAPLHIMLIGNEAERQIWSYLVTHVHYGTTQTYGALAANVLDRPKAARMVGRIVGANPVSVLVPCHRIVGSNGKLTGYHWGLARKEALLEAEAAYMRQREQAKVPVLLPALSAL